MDILTSNRAKPVIREGDPVYEMIKKAFPDFFKESGQQDKIKESEDQEMCSGKILDLVDINMLDKKDVEDRIKACVNLVQAGEDKEEAMSEFVEWIMNNFRSQRLCDYLEHESNHNAPDVRQDDPVGDLINAQIAYAKQKHGDVFHSLHEGYGVLLEEAEELTEAMMEIKSDMDEVWSAIREDDYKRAYDALGNFSFSTNIGIAEMSQIAAVVQKMIDTVDEMDDRKEAEVLGGANVQI